MGKRMTADLVSQALQQVLIRLLTYFIIRIKAVSILLAHS